MSDSAANLGAISILHAGEQHCGAVYIISLSGGVVHFRTEEAERPVDIISRCPAAPKVAFRNCQYCRLEANRRLRRGKRR